MPLLTLDGLAKAYNGVPALRSASLSIERGESHALMGENGAGKSTLIRILAGVLAPDAGSIVIDGRPVVIESPRAAHRLGLRFIHQELNVVPTLSVAENIFVGRRYPTLGGVFVNWRRLEAEAADALGRLGITHIHPRRKVGALSVGDRMLVRIASAFLGEGDGTPARLYVMDEPTAALSREESRRLFSVLEEIRGAGGAVLYVSHRLDEVMAICDRATVLRDGTTVDSGRLSEIGHDDLVALMIGRRVEEAYPPPLAPPGSEVAIEARDLVADGVGPVSFSVRRGEILGLAGLAGSGQRELLRALFGDLPRRSGLLALAGGRQAPRGPATAWRGGLAYVPRERRSEGLVLSRPIFENVTLPHLTAASRAGTLLAPGRERRQADALGAEVRLKAEGPAQLAAQLSGGNQQKVVFARALAGRPQVLLLDEPTRGVDIGARFDIYGIVRRMTAEGVAVILASTDLPELFGLCDRIAVMREGRITTIVPAAGLGEAELISLCYGRAAAATGS